MKQFRGKPCQSEYSLQRIRSVLLASLALCIATLFACSLFGIPVPHVTFG